VVERPNYAKWCNRKLWTIHEAVCLMLSVEPETPWLTDHARYGGGLDPLVVALEQYSELAAEAMLDGSLPMFSPWDVTRPALERRVIPRRFVEWARARNISIPEELAPVMVEKAAQSPAPVPAAPVFENLARGHIGPSAADAREQVLGAALAAMASFPERCRDAAGIRRVIEDNAPLIWSDARKPPLPAAEIEALLARWLGYLG
jgi:hypothetical protein